LAISIWFGAETPSDQLMATAQQGLDALVVSHPASLGGDIAFEPAHGWSDQIVALSGEPGSSLPSAWTTDADLAGSGDPSVPAALSNDQIRSLPPDAVIVSVRQTISTRNPLPETADYQPLPEPPNISDGRLSTGGWEGMPAQDVSQLSLRGVVNGRPISVQAYFRTTDPSAELIKQAQIGLNRLVVVPLAPPTAALDDFGISMRLPDDGHGWIYSYGDDPTLVATTADAQNPFYAPTVARGMGPSDVTIVLAESTAQEDLRWPPLDGPPQIGPTNLCVGCEVMDDGQPPAPGHVLYRNTFTSGGRAFDLYVEFGSAPSSQQLTEVNALLETLRLSPNPSPEPPPPGGSAVGSLPGGRPAVGPTDADRVLSWTYEFRASISVPDGWTGWTNLVTDSAEPLNVFGIGSWDLPQGGYCAPLTALQQLPSDGVLIWIDRFEGLAPEGVTPTPWPSSPRVGPGTDPAPSPTECTAGVPVQSFMWERDATVYAVHLAFGEGVTDANIQAATQTLTGLST
jgi:hypothetical protein